SFSHRMTVGREHPMASAAAWGVAKPARSLAFLARSWSGMRGMSVSLHFGPVSWLTFAVSRLTLAATMITKSQAIELYGSVKALQAALGLKTHSAIYMWPDGEPIPENHALRLRYQLKPEAFDEKGNYIAPTSKPRKRKVAGAGEAA